jgi:hypothetical protein
VRIDYLGQELCTQRLDMVVDAKVVVEVKSTAGLHPAASRQLYNYLRASTRSGCCCTSAASQSSTASSARIGRVRAARPHVLRP